VDNALAFALCILLPSIVTILYCVAHTHTHTCTHTQTCFIWVHSCDHDIATGSWDSWRAYVCGCGSVCVWVWVGMCVGVGQCVGTGRCGCGGVV